ncbi:hydroxymethylpyrimidine/phosphomethylpyrimidine kinase [Enterococcus olivae]
MVRKTLTIGGSDTWGGGGIQTDLKTFENLQVFGLSALTCIALDVSEDFTIQALSADLVEQQLQTIEKSFHLDGVKIGLLASIETIDVVLAFCQRNQGKFPIILDPVMAFKESDQRLYTNYLQKIKALIPFADLVTPNLTEMKMLLGLKEINTVAEMKKSCQLFIETFGTSVFLKGGNKVDTTSAVDYYMDTISNQRLDGPISSKTTIHGAGCCLSSAICGYLALGFDLDESLALSKKFVYEAIEQGISIDEAGNVWHPINQKENIL